MSMVAASLPRGRRRDGSSGLPRVDGHMAFRSIRPIGKGSRIHINRYETPLPWDGLRALRKQPGVMKVPTSLRPRPMLMAPSKRGRVWLAWPRDTHHSIWMPGSVIAQSSELTSPAWDVRRTVRCPGSASGLPDRLAINRLFEELGLYGV
jgi:hypothetical protein